MLGFVAFARQEENTCLNPQIPHQHQPPNQPDPHPPRHELPPQQQARDRAPGPQEPQLVGGPRLDGQGGSRVQGFRTCVWWRWREGGGSGPLFGFQEVGWVGRVVSAGGGRPKSCSSMLTARSLRRQNASSHPPSYQAPNPTKPLTQPKPTPNQPTPQPAGLRFWPLPRQVHHLLNLQVPRRHPRVDGARDFAQRAL